MAYQGLTHSDPLWYKDAIIYELHVRAFYDSNGDGIGDFPGLTQKLDYLQELGVTALWLLPFYPSPLRDDGYDVADYQNVHPAYRIPREMCTGVTCPPVGTGAYALTLGPYACLWLRL
jgi:1,4-alpha-glucan branching enzyme